MDVSVAAFRASLTEILKNIYWLEFDSNQEMCSTFLRFQEHYESPKFAGKYFSLEEFIVWYQGDYDEFTYYDDWSGFNIPSRILNPFREGHFDPLTEQEQHLLELFSDKSEPFYIIGTTKPKMPTASEEERLVLQHETAHGLFCANSDYRKEVLQTLTQLSDSTRKQLREWLLPEYAESSIVDEIHAYLLDGSVYLKQEGLEAEDIETVSNALHEIYDKYYQIQQQALDLV